MSKNHKKIFANRNHVLSSADYLSDCVKLIKLKCARVVYSTEHTTNLCMYNQTMDICRYVKCNGQENAYNMKEMGLTPSLVFW